MGFEHHDSAVPEGVVRGERGFNPGRCIDVLFPDQDIRLEDRTADDIIDAWDAYKGQHGYATDDEAFEATRGLGIGLKAFIEEIRQEVAENRPDFH